MITSGKKRTVVCVVGTRPEVIKMAPVVLALRSMSWAEVVLVSTAQHRELLDKALLDFDLVPDIDLNLMRANQSLEDLTARSLTAIGIALANTQPSMVLAQGDTTTVLSTALSCTYRGIPFAHVEAGLRTHDRRAPFPEEMNRVFASYLAELHFAPTAGARENLLREGVAESQILVTGNTVIDALLMQRGRGTLPIALPADTRTILVTMHRRENFGQGLSEICAALIDLLDKFPRLNIMLPVHPNPAVTDPIKAQLGSRDRLYLLPPLDYPTFVAAMEASHMILTDSGGVQEEAPTLSKPVLVMRNETERPEAIAAGAARLVGTGRQQIVDSVSELLGDVEAYQRLVVRQSPFGDGRAAQRIADRIGQYLGAQ